MTTPQWQIFEIIAVIGVPDIIFPLVAIALAWHSVKFRALYALLAFLTLWGLQSFFDAILRHLFNPPLGSITYPSPMFTVLLANATLVALVGFPILWSLRNALRK
ncbi:MAG: hypothetical protein KGK05_06410 [Xanthomonadaceae bacterium]|nr:hypothetical protein [Xanthomonadaceae bacterium]